jgi:glycosyltransferase involved in cell wall biosynthesis
LAASGIFRRVVRFAVFAMYPQTRLRFSQGACISVITLSVVVPVYSGEKFLQQLVDKITLLRGDFQGSQIDLREIVFVDDSAKDGSPRILDEIADRNRWVKVIHLSRNFGQHAATIAGIIQTSGDWVVTMDEDLQHPPERIPDLLRKVSEAGSDVVYASGMNSVHRSLFRDLSSRGYKRMMEWLTGNKNLRHVSSFRLIRGSIARASATACPSDIYFDVMLSWFTTRFASVLMDLRDDRYIQTGSSGYNVRSLLSHARRMLASSQVKVLRLGALFGVIILTISVIASLALIFLDLFAPGWLTIRGWASQMLATLFFGGLTVFMIGIVLEYITIMLTRSHGKPLFFAVDRSSDAVLRAQFDGRTLVSGIHTGGGNGRNAIGSEDSAV